MYLYPDISEHNGAVNFERMKQHAGGVMIRLSLGFRDDGEGNVYRLDNRALANIKGAQEAGLPWGVYHYSYAKNQFEAGFEAIGVIRQLAYLRQQGFIPSLPIAYDMEDNNDLQGGDHGGAGWQTLGRCCQQFCQILENAGYYAIIYASKSWLQQLPYIEKFDHWAASWGVSKPDIPCGLWQFTNQGSGLKFGVASSAVDLNKAFKDYPTIIKNAGLNGWKKPEQGVRPVTPPRPAEPTKPTEPKPETQPKKPAPLVEIKFNNGRVYQFNEQGEVIN